jgi:hypothetical protein
MTNGIELSDKDREVINYLKLLENIDIYKINSEKYMKLHYNS